MDSYDVKLIERPTGRMHNVTGAGIQPIINEETGEPETEYVLVAEKDGHYVDLGTFTAGYVAHQVGRPDTEVKAKAKARAKSSPTPDAEPGSSPSSAAG